VPKIKNGDKVSDRTKTEKLKRKEIWNGG